jgi:hypothetical protein
MNSYSSQGEKERGVLYIHFNHCVLLTPQDVRYWKQIASDPTFHHGTTPEGAEERCLTHKATMYD